jgi:hypothetical protein
MNPSPKPGMQQYITFLTHSWLPAGQVAIGPYTVEQAAPSAGVVFVVAPLCLLGRQTNCCCQLEPTGLNCLAANRDAPFALCWCSEVAAARTSLYMVEHVQCALQHTSAASCL